MVHYFAKEGVVHYKRLAITTHTGVAFAEPVEGLEELVKEGLLVKETGQVEQQAEQPVAQPVKNETPAPATN